MKKEQYSVENSEDYDEWYIVRRWIKDGFPHREVLTGRYRSPEDANEVMLVMFETHR